MDSLEEVGCTCVWDRWWFWLDGKNLSIKGNLVGENAEAGKNNMFLEL